MKTNLPLIQAELGADGQGNQRITAIFGKPGGTTVYVRVPLLSGRREEVLQQSLAVATATLETK